MIQKTFQTVCRNSAPRIPRQNLFSELLSGFSPGTESQSRPNESETIPRLILVGLTSRRQFDNECSSPGYAGPFLKESQSYFYQSEKKKSVSRLDKLLTNFMRNPIANLYIMALDK